MDQFNQISKAVKDKTLQFSQAQGSTTEQLKELMSIANMVGLYDAADVIKRLIEQKTKSN